MMTRRSFDAWMCTMALLLVFTMSSIAQQVHKDYFDGRIYLMLSEGCGTDISSSFMQSRAAEMLPSQQYLQDLFSQYGVEKIDDYFKHLNDRRFDKVYEITFKHFFRIDAFIAALESDPCVVYAEKVPIMYTSFIPSDPRRGGQWTLDAVQAYAAWDIHREPTREVVIAIVDDAVRIDHEDLAPNLWINKGEIPNNGIDDDGNGYIDDVYGYDVAENRSDPSPPFASSGLFSHGTHCAGIASAATDNDLGVASLGYNCKIMSVKGKRDANASNTIDNTTAGIVYAIANNPDVISMSFGGGGGGNTIQNIFTLAFERGILCLSSAGNSNTDLQFYPAAYKHVYSVASTAPGNQKSGFSNYGDWIDISAPGSGILSTVAGSPSDYTNFSGTSMACPNVAGLAGYLFGYHRNVTLQDVVDCMLSTADDLDASNPGFEGLLGAGQINALKAIECLANKPPTPRAIFPRIQYVNSKVTFSDKSLNGLYSKWTLQDQVISEAASFEYEFNNVGTYRMALEIAEGVSIEEVITVLPRLEAPYFQDSPNFAGDFESDLGHFAVQNIQGTPIVRGRSQQNLKNGTNSGNFAYVLGPDVPFYQQESKAYLYTPMFDFTEEAMYELSFFGRYEMNTGLDGLHVEYSVDGGVSWQVLGTEKANWYNYTNRAVAISAYQLGASYFTGRQSQFRKFRYNVTGLLGQSAAFRFSFNSQENGLAAGFAIDDFVITRSNEAPMTVLRSFTGQFNIDRRIQLDWSTRPEFFCRGFRVESSVNGRDWITETYVNGQLFDIELFNYSWTTINTRGRDLHFFRLYVENRNEDGSYDESFYSPTIVVRKNLKGINVFQMMPNPFTDFVDLVFTDLLSTDLEYFVYDLSGKEVAKGIQPAGQGYYRIPMPELPSGMYLLNVTFGENSSDNKSLKIIRQ